MKYHPGMDSKGWFSQTDDIPSQVLSEDYNRFQHKTGPVGTGIPGFLHFSFSLSAYPDVTIYFSSGLQVTE